jgi:glycosyltransferase involved in cell wall biosynthesis
MEYSIVVPVYNSEDSLESLFKSICETLDQVGKEYEIIFVDDYSSDTSWEKLLAIKKTAKIPVRLVRFAANYGQHSATFCGLKYAKGKVMVTIDDDLQNPPSEIPKLIEKIGEAETDLVYGIGEKSHSTTRKVGSRIWKLGARKIDGGLGEGSSFRAMTMDLRDKLVQHNHSVIFIDELLYWHTNHIQFVTVEHHPRKIGKSGYTPFKLLRMVVKLSFNYSTVPLKLMTYSGVTLSAITFILGILFFIRKAFFGVGVTGFTAIIVTILFSTSIILISFGIIGKYLSNIFVALNNKPSYSIKDTKL